MREAVNCVADGLALLARVHAVCEGPGASEVTVEIESEHSDEIDSFIITVERKEE